MENSLGKTNTEWSQIAEELKELGGEVGWMNLSGLDERISKIETEIKKYNKSKDKNSYKNILSSAGFYLQGASKSIEMSSRLAAYKAAIDSGVSKKQAAVLAKNLTVNFDKKGELGALLNSLYLFSNANIQGVAIMIKNLYKSPRARRTVAGIMAGSVAVNFINAGINGDEWDKIPDALKMRNLIIMKPDGNYIKIPLPYGYNIFKYLGDVTYDVTTGKKDIIDGMMSFFGSVNEAFNPLGAGQKFRQFLPTVMRPVAEIAQNENWLNLPIKPEQKPYKGKIPESQLYFKSIPGYAKWATDKLNEISGGTEKVSGRVDISPEYIDHIVDFVGGGTGRFVTNTLQTTSDLIQGEDLKANNIPFYRTVVGEKHESRNTRIVYDMLKDAGRKKYNTKQKEIFYEALKSAKKEKTIDVNTYFDLKEKFKKDQRAVDKSLKKR